MSAVLTAAATRTCSRLSCSRADRFWAFFPFFFFWAKIQVFFFFCPKSCLSYFISFPLFRYYNTNKFILHLKINNFCCLVHAALFRFAKSFFESKLKLKIWKIKYSYICKISAQTFGASCEVALRSTVNFDHYCRAKLKSTYNCQISQHKQHKYTEFVEVKSSLRRSATEVSADSLPTSTQCKGK